DAQFLEYLQYDGLTVTLVASYDGLQCGETYHIKLAMADVSDTAWDSAVFLEAGSFDVSGSLIEAFVINPSPDLGDNSILEGCIDGTFVIHPPGCQTEDIVIELLTGGTATEGEDYSGVPASITISGEDVVIPITTIADNIAEGDETVTLYFIYTNIDDELDTASATINLVDYTLPTVTVDDLFICGASETTVVTVENGFGDFSYLYSSGQTTQTASYSEGESGEYTLTVTDFCEETASDNFIVEEPEPLVVTPTYDLCFGVFSGLIAQGGANPYIFTYDPDSLSFNGENAFEAIYPGVFEVIVTDQCGNSGLCLITTEQCDTVIPNIFTPNGDGVNDTFAIEGIDGFPSSSLKIYNRWGNLLLDSPSYGNNWGASDCPDGVYYYIFSRSDGKTQEGYVHVLSQK
ncbi:MAG: gliding motility-associated C-terminal domain-containing protein, partial [Flavobacteriales bacterium]